MRGISQHISARVRAIPSGVVLAVKLAFGLSAVVIVGTMVDWPTVTANLNGLYLPILAGIALMVPMLMITALRWKILIGTDTPQRFGFLAAVRGWGLGVFTNLVLPGVVGGDVARAHYATVRAQINYPRALGVALNERLFGLLSLCVLASIGVALNDHVDRFTQIPSTLLALGLAIAAVIIIVGVGLTRRYTQISFLLIPLLVLLSVAGQSSDFLLLHFYGQAIAVDIPLPTLLLVVPLVFVASVLPLTPGGHGVREVTLTALLTLAGIPVSEAALIALMLLVTKIGFGLVCGVALIDGSHLFRKATQPVTQA